MKAVLACKRCLICIFLSWFRRDDFFHWREQRAHILAGSKICFLKTCSFWLLKTLTDVLECVDYLWIIVMFLSAVFDSPCDGTHSLQRISFVSKWCNATFLQISSDEEKLIYILESQRVSIFSANFHFWVNNSFKWTLKLNDLSLFQHFKLIFLSLNPKLWYLTAVILIGALKLLHIGLI